MSYEAHFGLRQRPFRPAPDTLGYYPATSHEQALSQLSQALADDEGLVLVSGAPGTGKTLVCLALIERWGQETTTSFLTHGHYSSRAGLLQALLYDLSLPYEGKTEAELRLALTDFLLRNYSAGKKARFVIDEAHHLSPEHLEELRLLGNLEGRQAKAIQVVLAAQLPLLDTLQRPELASLAQRLVVRAALEPMKPEEAADYLLHGVRCAGGRPEDIFAADALELLARGTQGVPRLLNQTAHQALTLAYSVGAEVVDAEAALEALAVLGLEAAEVVTDSIPENFEDEEEPAATLTLPEKAPPGRLYAAAPRGA